MDFSKKRKTEEENGNTGSPPQRTTVLNTPSAEDIRKILQPLTQEQLLELLQRAAIRHSDVLEDIRVVADRDSTLRKLFVRGLAGETTTDTLRSAFSSFGEIDEAIVIFDKSTGKSKGYGFVTFKHVDGAILALKEPSKKIDGRMTVTQLAAAGVSGGQGANVTSAGAGDVSARKIFVGNVPFDISSERLLSFFLAFGEIEEGPLGFDKGSGKSKGFAFFVYRTEEGARSSLAEPVKNIDGHQVLCKLAVDNKKGKPNQVGFTGDGLAAQQPQSAIPGNTYGLQSQYGHPPYGSYTGGHQGPATLPGNNYGFHSSMGGAGMPSFGSQVPSGSGYGPGIGGAYSGSQFGGPASGDFGGRLPPNATATPAGAYHDGSHFGQQQQPTAVPRLGPGGMYQGMPPYY